MSGKVITKKIIADALEQVAEKMGRLAESMEYVNEPQWITHAYELMGAADMITGWIKDIRNEIKANDA